MCLNVGRFTHPAIIRRSKHGQVLRCKIEVLPKLHLRSFDQPNKTNCFL